MPLIKCKDCAYSFSFEEFGFGSLRISGKSILLSKIKPNYRKIIIQITEKYSAKLPNINKSIIFAADFYKNECYNVQEKDSRQVA